MKTYFQSQKWDGRNVGSWPYGMISTYRINAKLGWDRFVYYHRRTGYIVILGDISTKNKRTSNWQPFRHWLHLRLSEWQPRVQPVTRRLSIWRPLVSNHWQTCMACLLGIHDAKLWYFRFMNSDCLRQNLYDKEVVPAMVHPIRNPI